MRLVMTQEERDLAAMLRHLFSTHCAPALVRRLQEPGEERLPKELWGALVDAGVLGLPFGEEHGGAGGRLTDLGTVYLEAGRSLCPSVVYSTLHLGLAVDRLASDAQRARLLPGITAGQVIGSVALWNPYDAGQVRPRLQATPAPNGESWRVHGSLEFVADADLADVLLVSAEVHEPAEPRRVVGMIVDTAAPGFRLEQHTTMGGDRYSRVHMDEVSVAGDDVLTGVDGAGLSAEDLRRVANVVVALQCLEMVGGAEAVLRRTVEYTKGREQFGRSIASFQAAQHIVADMHIALQAARLAARSAVFWLDRGHVATRETAIARMHAAAAYRAITLDAHQLHGGMGYVLETDLHLWSERARLLATFDGTVDTAAHWLQKEIGLV